MCAYADCFAVVKYDYLIGIFDRVRSLRNDKHRHIRAVFLDCRSQLCICSKVKCACAVVKYQYLRVCGYCPCNSKSLLLTARKVLTALKYLVIKSVFELFDKLISL